jgi:acylphosphatase
MKKRVHVIVQGAVQGVGFRYFALRTAQKHAIQGYVKNCSNGNVELDIEGETERIDTFLHEIQTGARFAEIDHVALEWQQEVLNYSGFEIQE